MSCYNQLDYAQRCQLHALKLAGKTQQEIADIIGVSQATVSRELRRNIGDRGYRHLQAHRKAEERREQAANATKMTPELIAIVELKVKEKLSPEQISGWLLVEEEVLLSHETIYHHIRANRAAGGDLYKNLRREGKAYKRHEKGQAGRGCIKNRISIDERPAIVEAKERVGDWEIDLVIGKGHSGALVTIVDRATSFTVSERINDKSAQTVTDATIKLLSPYKGAVSSDAST